MLIDGKKIAQQIQHTLTATIEALAGRKPGLAFIRIGEDPASKVYIQLKKKKCQEIGILSKDYELAGDISHEEVTDIIHLLNQDPTIDGILLQLPIPAHLSPLLLIEEISPEKDVDGFHPLNIGRLFLGQLDGQIPCTPKGVHRLLLEMNIPLSGKRVVIVGRSNIVGKPLAALLMQKDPRCNATVTVAHSGSLHLADLCKEADILIACMGKPLAITQEMVRKGAVVIDVGMNRIQSPSQSTPLLVGDVDFTHVAPLCSYITPVPGGVGPMTIIMLMENTLHSFFHLEKKRGTLL